MTATLVTTAIPYVNATPHLGFAYELVLGDVIARHRRRRGHDVRFVTGTDENSLKNVAAAGKLGVTVRSLVDRNAESFRALGPLLDVAPDDFVRTATDSRHRIAVDWLWRACQASGDLYKRRWEGRYCLGCEAFVDDDVEICEDHGAAPERVVEDNWFFRLSRYRDRIRDTIASGRLAVVSESARAETLAFLDRDVHDLSVSRDVARAAGWGIPVPGDPSQVIYVWFDALANYLASLELGSPASELLERYWHAANERVHVIGKGITRFHAVYWPAFLLSAGLPLPDRVLVHGYLTVDGKKIAKSGLGFDVPPIVERFGADALRWYFVRRCRTRNDSDVRLAEIAATYDGDIGDRLGNLVQRCGTLIERVSSGSIPSVTDEPRLRALAEALPARVDSALVAFLFDDAVAAIVELLDAANRTLEATAPWRVARTDPAAAAALLYAPLEAARIAAGELAPFVPGVAATIAHRLGTADLAPGWGRLCPGTRWIGGPPPFPRLQSVDV